MNDQIEIDRELNLRGEVCPYTFVKSKLELEGMLPGQLLRITVDNGESAANVPRSLDLEGHEVIDVARGEQAVWRILVRKAAGR
jgi:TusA-related sulfurtransferase